MVLSYLLIQILYKPYALLISIKKVKKLTLNFWDMILVLKIMILNNVKISSNRIIFTSYLKIELPNMVKL